MINLLDPKLQKQHRASLANTLLLRYVFLSIGALGLLLAAAALSYVFLKSNEAKAQTSIDENTAKTIAYRNTEKQANEFRDNLKKTKEIINNETYYTAIVTDIAQALPSGVIMDQLTLDKAAFGTPTTLELRATSHKKALQLKSSFQKSDMFDDVNFAAINSDSEGNSRYPYTVQLNVTINPKTKEGGS